MAIFSVVIALLLSNGRLVNGMLEGVEVPIEQIPFQASVETSQIQCSAAILSPTFLITTGTCGEYFRVNVPIAKLRFGVTSRWYDGTQRWCGNMTQHPKFLAGDNTYDQKDYDVAILEFAPELPLDNVTMKTISIVSAAPAVGTTLSVSGWGSIHDGGPTMVYARQASVKVTDHVQCRTAFQDVFPVSDRMLCAGSPNGVMCDADNADLLITSSGQLAGLASWGYGCGRSGVPDVYVNLANPEIRKFINDVTGL